jgi:pentatricopeptide repeat protein
MDGVLHCWKIAVQDLNLTPDEGLCISVLHTAARHGLPDLATDVLRVLKLIGVPWEEYHFAPLIEAFCRADQVAEALQTLGIMRTNEIEPLIETAYPLLDIVKQDTDTVDSVWTIIDKLHKEEKRIDINAINVLIQASVLLGDLQRAVGAYKSFSEYGLTPDLTTFNILLQGCVVASHRELGSLLLADMKEAKIKPNQETYERFISLCLTQDNYEDAFFYLEEMKAAGHVPPSSVYVSILRKCISAGDTRYTIAAEEMRETGYLVPLDLMYEMKDAAHGAEQPYNDHSTSAEGQAVGLDGAAQRFIETGGLAGMEELGKAPSTYG